MRTEPGKEIEEKATLRCLAIETSTEICSVALSVDSEIIVMENRGEETHSECILPMIDRLMRKTTVSLDEIDVIGFGAGPGSFTGVRLGCSVAQGIAFAKSIPVVPVSSLEALAQATKFDKVVICQDARMKQVYSAAYINSGGVWLPQAEPCVCDPEDVHTPEGDDWVVCGSGVLAYLEVLEPYFSSSKMKINTEFSIPSAREIVTICVREFESGNAVIADDAEPIYVRNKVALTLDEQASSR